ncbi:hypothetical protein [Sulfuricystis multivorans]|uniref:hypothetical protein n=1 Tax=Sulfuricystis multivorans TaxID=2211108 RepID=UPI000F844A86|nr:hypothetical protein [Sulfuricystis multivorans]
MDDLRALNKRILMQMGPANVNLHSTLNLLTVCLGKLKPSASELSTVATVVAHSHHQNPPDVTAINKEYLLFARQTARDVLSGYFDGLIILSINMAQARVLARLTNQQISDISRRWPGTIFDVSGAATLSIRPLHQKAIPHYSAAMLAAAA